MATRLVIHSASRYRMGRCGHAAVIGSRLVTGSTRPARRPVVRLLTTTSVSRIQSTSRPCAQPSANTAPSSTQDPTIDALAALTSRPSISTRPALSPSAQSVHDRLEQLGEVLEDDLGGETEWSARVHSALDDMTVAVPRQGRIGGMFHVSPIVSGLICVTHS